MKAPQCGNHPSGFDVDSSVPKRLPYADLLELGSMTAAKENGKVRQKEGKKYVVQRRRRNAL